MGPLRVTRVFGLETIGVAQAGVGALIGLGLESLGTLLAHGFIDEQADALGEAAGAFFIEELQNGVQKFRIALVGHFGVYVGCGLRHPNRKPVWPASNQFFRARAPLPRWARLRSARYARPSLAEPQRGSRAEEGKAIYQKRIHNPQDLQVKIDAERRRTSSLKASRSVSHLTHDRKHGRSCTQRLSAEIRRIAKNASNHPARRYPGIR